MRRRFVREGGKNRYPQMPSAAAMAWAGKRCALNGKPADSKGGAVQPQPAYRGLRVIEE